jgi:hypothetical protein
VLARGSLDRRCVRGLKRQPALGKQIEGLRGTRNGQVEQIAVEERIVAAD